MLDRAHPMQPQPGGWYELTVTGRARRHALQIPHRRRDRGARSGLAFPARSDVSGPSEVIDHDQYRMARRTTGAAGRGRRRCSSNCMSARSRPAAPFARRSTKLDHVRRDRPHRDRADADRRFRRPPQLGLRRRAALRARQRLRPAGRSQGADRRRASARADGVSRRRLQSLRTRREIICGRYAPAFFTAAHTPWGTAIDYRVPQVRAFAIEQCAALAARTTASTGCASMPCMPSCEPGEPSLLQDLSRAVGEFAGRDRPA